MSPAALLLCLAPAVVDGDTIACSDARVRLWGISAPELREPGGSEAKTALAIFVSEALVACTVRDRDRYGRLVATCSVSGRDLGEAMVSSGHARDCPAFSGGRYAGVEAEASKALPLPGYCR